MKILENLNLREIMKTNISKNEVVKYLFILLIVLIYANILFYMYKNKVDDFAPKHIGASYMLLEGYELRDYYLFLFRSAPAFYAFIAALLGITGINEYYIPILPFEFFPYFLIVLVLSYKLVNTKKYTILWLLILFDFVYFSQSLTGSHFIFLWSHGIGEILFFIALLLIVEFIKTNNIKYLFLTVIITISLILTSYDVNFWLLLFIFGMLISIYILKLFGNRVIDNIKNRLIFLSVLVFVLVVVYNIYVSQNTVLETVLVHLSVSMFFDTIFRIWIQFFTGKASGEIYLLLLKYPQILTYIYLLKYIIYGLIILTGFFALKKLILKFSRNINILLIYYFSMLILTLSYALIRIAIGHFAITMIFYIVMFSIFLIIFAYSNTQKILRFLSLVLIIWLILNFTAIYAGQKYNIVHDYNYEYIIVSSLWGNSNIPSGGDKIVFPDQLTFEWWFISYAKANNVNQLGYLWSWKDILGIYCGENIKSNVYIPLNYRANYIFANTGGWDTLKPFKDYRNKIETNPSIKQKIYSAGEHIVIVHT